MGRLDRHGHSSAGQGHDDRPLLGEGQQLGCKAAAGLTAIGILHRLIILLSAARLAPVAPGPERSVPNPASLVSWVSRYIPAREKGDVGAMAKATIR